MQGLIDLWQPLFHDGELNTSVDNPSMIRRERLHIAQCAGAIQSVAATMRLTAGWDIVCQPQSQASCQQWLGTGVL